MMKESKEEREEQMFYERARENKTFCLLYIPGRTNVFCCYHINLCKDRRRERDQHPCVAK